MLTKSTLLLHYKRKDIRDAMVQHALDREIAIKYGDKGFGSRPGTLVYPNDILDSVMQGATSFHASEERWKNPLQLSPTLPKRDLDELRLSWDLILDVDCPVWDVAKLVSHELVVALQSHGVKQISCKFSGGKGFHIGVPCEAFPQSLGSMSLAQSFPEVPRKIAQYLVYMIGPKVKQKLEKNASLKEWVTRAGLNWSDVAKQKCKSCGEISPLNTQEFVDFVCSVCQHNERTLPDKLSVQCPKKHGFMQRTGVVKKEGCSKCGKKATTPIIDMTHLLSVDTVLISPRHLYRMPYSLHEKSGLCSVPIDPNQIMSFEKELAVPSKVVLKYAFLDRSNKEPTAGKLLMHALDHSVVEEDPRLGKEKDERTFQNLTEAAPEWSFPPCIEHIAKGLHDGKKRAMFILINFLSSLKWSAEDIGKYLEAWNDKNPEPLREVLLQGQVRYHKQSKKEVLPPNCDNKMYYKDLGICHPNSLCRKIKNPVNYAIIKIKIKAQDEKKEKKSQKEQ